ncbi:MAG: S41 family peptidase [Prevotella sp.]|jgi:carboxyl-terminal processing protease|nr:S41 family peptidase [Prevotella sp.]
MRRIFLAIIAVLATMGCKAQEVKNHNLEVAKNLEIFNAIYKNLDLMYVDTLDASTVIGTGINAMLRSLDPYTEYYPQENQKDLKLLMTGKYAGIGALVRYHQRLKRVVIEEPYAGMPAAEVGLKKGDIILQIDDTLMTDKTVSYVSEHLRGEAGTTFMLKIQRPSTGKTMKFKITRQSIKMPEITYYGMRPNGVGYIILNTFTGEPSKPMRRAFLDLKKQGATKLVLDLRGNGGGVLSECVDIANMWIPKGLTLVETKGKIRRVNSEYKTRLEPIDTVMPLVILVNDETASASEIVSGSVQDLDRGVIIGTRTYGKGLVQVPNIEVPYNGNLKLTTSKYYIPSGRCIQAINYKHTGGGYKERVPDSLTHVFYTKNGREVRDGGGIKPDIEVKPDTLANITLYLDRLDSTEVMLDYVVDYISKHPTIAAPKDFHLTDADYADFKQRVVKAGFTYDQVSKKQFQDLVKVAKFEGYYDEARAEFEALKAKLDHHDISRDLDLHREEIQHMLEQDIISAYYFQAGQVEAALEYDKTMKEAERILNTPGEYEKLLKGGK